MWFHFVCFFAEIAAQVVQVLGTQMLEDCSGTLERQRCEGKIKSRIFLEIKACEGVGKSHFDLW